MLSRLATVLSPGHRLVNGWPLGLLLAPPNIAKCSIIHVLCPDSMSMPSRAPDRSAQFLWHMGDTSGHSTVSEADIPNPVSVLTVRLY